MALPARGFFVIYNAGPLAARSGSYNISSQGLDAGDRGTGDRRHIQIIEAADTEIRADGKAEYEFWKEGGPGRAALHAIASGLLGGVTDWQGALAGALGGATSALLAPKVRELVEDFVKQPGLTGSAAEMMINTVTSGILAGVGGIAGGTGAAYAGNAYQHNFLTHKQLDELKQALSDCATTADVAACKATVSKTYSDLDFAQENKLDACRSVTCVQDLLGDLNQNSRVEYMTVFELQELGLDEAVAQRLYANQV
ncbi:hypothetical protein DUT91_03580 [Phyllobacterium salinisoli]|uniref:DUF637 domain-containing protein n=1 Tax=Phyllobacterium salinisoli TaxID=1899321 RepID=A0A368K9D1_9HYPH|nr:hypothetical protein [Phyllobacterium salinisoli]RCS25851.1 hypothetical protein DUT91_03580 [Phyllobacterium salinisoli]